MRTSEEHLLIEEGIGGVCIVEFDRTLIGSCDCILKKCCKKYKKKGKKPCRSCPKR